MDLVFISAFSEEYEHTQHRFGRQAGTPLWFGPTLRVPLNHKGERHNFEESAQLFCLDSGGKGRVSWENKIFDLTLPNLIPRDKSY